MRHVSKFLWILTILCLGPFSVMRAAERALVLDPERTTVDFRLGATAHTVEGNFAMIEGHFLFDTETGSVSGEVKIDATRAETGNKKRDKAMHHKVLESEKYPHFVLKPERIEGSLPSSGTGKLTLHGTIAIHGDEHPIVLPAEVEVHGNDLQMKVVFSIPFVEWGMTDPSFLFFRVEKVVQVTVSSHGVLSDAVENATEDAAGGR